MTVVPWIAGLLVVAGIGAFASRNAELIRRWRTWLIAAVLVCGCLWFGAVGAAVLAAVLGVTAAVEYGRLARVSRADTAVVAAAAIALPAVAWAAPHYLTRAVAAALLAAALLPVLDGDTGAGARRAAANVFGVAWLAALTGLVLLATAALPLIVAVSVADVGAWCAGRLLRGPRLSPLSPAKRWSGVLGGAVAGVAALALTGALTAPLAVAVAAGGPAGDLLESMVKRSAGVKDAGSWLPGFGGLLDRIDSLLIALAVAVIL